MEKGNIHNNKKPETRTSAVSGREIAIIGLALRTAQSNNVEEFWNNLAEGKNLNRPIPEPRKKDIVDFLEFENKKNSERERPKQQFRATAHLDEN